VATHADTLEADRLAAQRAEAERLAAEAEAERLAAQAEAERLAAQAEAERLAAEAERATTQPTDDPVWETLAGALGPDVAADEPIGPPVLERPLLPQVPQVPPPPDVAWQVGGPPAGMPGWAPPPPPPGLRPSGQGWNGAPVHAGGMTGHGGNGQLRSGIRPCPRCDLALSANARFCRRCGLPQG
jgi:hypothetical protein